MGKRNLGRILGLCLALALTAGLLQTAFAAEFSDVSANVWYHDAVDYVSNHGLMSGTGSGRFDPDGSMSRAMLVAVLYRMDGSPAVSGNGGFSDVPSNQYYAPAVAWAAGNGIVSGVGGGQFAPNTLISREQFAAILYRYAAYKGYNTAANANLSSFADAGQVSTYAVDALRWAVGAGIMSGSNGRLMPSGSATRAQAAVMLMQFAEYADSSVQQPSPPEQPQPAGSKTLVAYFSRANFVAPGTDAISGATASAANTKTVAEHIQQTVSGDLFEIVPVRDYPESHSECSQIAGQELAEEARPELSTHVQNMDEYDTIILGYPAWHHTAPMAVRTFLEEYNFSGKTIIPYMTSLGNSVDQSVADIRQLCPGATVMDGIALTSGSSSRWNQLADEWLEGLDIAATTTPAVSERTAVTLDIDGRKLDAWLNNTRTAQELISRLPVTVTLADSDNDYCGGIHPALPYDDGDVQFGYHNGDLAFWTTGNDFVIFVGDEEYSANTGSLVILGQITSDYSFLIGRGGSINVTLSLQIMYEAVIFDLDGVLFDTEPAYLDVRYRFAKEKNPTLRIEELYGTVGHTSRETWRIIADKIGNGQPWEELLLEFTPIAEQAYPQLDFKALLRSDVPDTLDFLRTSGFKLAVASANDFSLVHCALNKAEILPYFDAVLSGDNCRMNKPSPEIYLRVAKAVKTPVEKCLSVEDSTIGIRAAHDAGIPVAALKEHRFPFHQALADYEINSIGEILSITESRF